jgi:tRNA U34 2-thiouridine synthase MnmA/TrmU
MGERWYLQQKQGARNMNKNYTNEQVAQMIKSYGEGNTDAERKDIMEALAREMGKTVGSIRAKLVAVGHYIKLSGSKTTTSTKANVTTKSDLAKLIEGKLGIKCPSLVNMTKDDLHILVGGLV